MNKMKYIVVQQGNDLEYPVLFPLYIGHDEMACKFGLGNIVSAGFCVVNSETHQANAWGESVSLGIKSRESDYKLLVSSLT